MIGIKGTGMSALAVMLKQRGNIVLGSDISTYIYTEENLHLNNIPILTYSLDNLKEEYFYIIQGENNSIEALYVKKHYTYKYYVDFIASLDLNTICISGTHGKTTTTSILKHIFKNDNFIIGNSFGEGNINSSRLFLEACEYKDHFLKYKPEIGIILNVEMDHVDYFKSKEQLFNSFYKFAENCKKCIYNGDILKLDGISFGYNNDNDYVIKDNYILHNFKKTIIDYSPLSKGLMYDFTCAFIICELLNQEFDITNFKMPKKRFNEFFYHGNYIVDDYAHHPSELKNVLELINNKYKTKPVIIFEPHQYVRLKYFQKEFYDILKNYESYIMPLYNARSNKKHDISFFIKPPLKDYASFNMSNYNNKVILFASASKDFKTIFK